MAISKHIDIVSLITLTKKAPVRRGFLGTGIVPTGELEGREDLELHEETFVEIVPTEGLGGREDPIPVSE